MESQINEFIEYLRYEKNYSEYTIKNYNIDLEQFSLFCKEQNIKNLSNVDYQFIRKYLNVLYDNNYASKTICRLLSSLRILFDYFE